MGKYVQDVKYIAIGLAFLCQPGSLCILRTAFCLGFMINRARVAHGLAYQTYPGYGAGELETA